MYNLCCCKYGERDRNFWRGIGVSIVTSLLYIRHNRKYTLVRFQMQSINLHEKENAVIFVDTRLVFATATYTHRHTCIIDFFLLLAFLQRHFIETCLNSYLFSVRFFPLTVYLEKNSVFHCRRRSRFFVNSSYRRWHNGNAINCSSMHIWCLEHAKYIRQIHIVNLTHNGKIFSCIFLSAYIYLHWNFAQFLHMPKNRD